MSALKFTPKNVALNKLRSENKPKISCDSKTCYDSSKFQALIS